MSPEKSIILTPGGFKKVEEELNRLRVEEQPRISLEINQALNEGGSDDNPVYDSAREQLEQIDRRIAELEEISKSAQVSVPTSGDTAVVGSVVTVEVGGQTDTYTLVGSIEASPTEGKISHVSPVGKALMGKRAGETSKVTTPFSTMTYKIVKIS